MKAAKVWIENNPNTGELKPWEVWFQVEGFPPRRVASCKDETGANKSKIKVIARNSEYYHIQK